MKRLAVLALVLGLAACGAGMGASAARTAPLVIGGTAPVSVGAAVIGPFPLDGVFVYEADPRCPGASNVLPDLPTAVCMRAKAIEYLTAEVISGRLKPGPKFRSCTFPSDPAYPGCIEYTLRNAAPEIRFGRSPAWVNGAVQGVPYSGCAAGVSYGPYIRVSIADAARTQRLAAWETGNVTLTTLDRYLDTDSPIVGAATDFAALACGVN